MIDWESGCERALDSRVQLWGVLNPPRLEHKPTSCCCSSSRSCWGGDFHLEDDIIPQSLLLWLSTLLWVCPASHVALIYDNCALKSVSNSTRSAQACPLATLTGSYTTLIPSLMESGTLIISTSSGFENFEKNLNAVTNIAPQTGLMWCVYWSQGEFWASATWPVGENCSSLMVRMSGDRKDADWFGVVGLA